MKLETASGNAGLFSETGAGAEIRNVNVNADVISSVSGASYGTGGLIGRGYYPTVLENCSVSGSIRNTATDGNAVYTGGLVGYQADKLTMKNCCSSAEVKSDSKYYNSAVGGLIGKGGNYMVTAENCYATGSVTAEGTYAGGFMGYGAFSHSYTNCYAAGTVIGKDAYGFMYNSKAADCTFTNCFYNSNKSGLNIEKEGLSGKTTDEMKLLSNMLGDAYQEDNTGINGGYPILIWQYLNPEATAVVKISVEPKNSVLFWNETEQPVDESGVYIFNNVPVGKYSYSVLNEEGDYQTQNGQISVRGKNVEKIIKLQKNQHKLIFSMIPSDAALSVTSEGQQLTPVSDNIYLVTNGVYQYEASAFGYKTKKAETTVECKDKTESIILEAQPRDTVNFVYKNGTADSVEDGRLIIKSGDREIKAEDDSSGMTYKLPAGYQYQYIFTSRNYARQTGILDLTGLTEEKSETVEIVLEKKTAWEGTEDVLEPQRDEKGVYQIGTGSELAWLAQKINSGEEKNCSAVLIKDIDLGNQNWTPIGTKSGWNTRYFEGTFDGQGFTVKNLNIESSESASQGLFGYVSNGTIKNLTVAGEIKINGNGASAAGIAGIVGTFDGTSGRIENCINKVKISGGQNTAGIAGYISGGYSSANKRILNCANFADIESGSSNAAGIAGYISGQVTVDSCYNRGDCTSGSWRAGGITAYLANGNSCIKNCYSTGVVKVSNGSDCGAVIGKIESGIAENNYFLDTAGSDSNAEAKKSEELKELASALGNSFIKSPQNLNDGYPIFRFQIPSYDVVFYTGDKNAVIEIEGHKGEQSGEQWSFCLPDGTYNYTAYSYGKKDVTGTVTVSGKDIEKNLNFTEQERKTIYFDIMPEDVDAVITIEWRGKTVEQGTAGSYNLPYGNYQYIIKAKGYAKKSETLQVDNETGDRISVVLVPSSSWDGKEQEKPSGEGTQQNPYQIENGGNLAWFATLVNKEKTKNLYAELTDDIDLGNCSWIPIGKESCEFQGEFNGNGFTISGLHVTNTDYAGLFGVIENAVIQNLVVKGSVDGNQSAAGVAGRVKSVDCRFVNCGNEVTVSGNNAGGIVGNIFNYGITCTIEGCYNYGKITAEERAGGMIGYNNGIFSVKDCYNIGDVSSNDYAGGIVGGNCSLNSIIKDSYNGGEVKGKDKSKTGALSTGMSDSYINCYYLKEAAESNGNGAEAITGEELQLLTISNAFEHVIGMNSNYPVLKWQKLKPTSGESILAEKTEFETELVHIPSFADVTDANYYKLATPNLKWKPIDGVEKYAVTIWKRTPCEKESSIEDLKNFLYWRDEEAARYLSEEQLAHYKELKATNFEDGKVTHPKAEYLQKIFKEQKLTLPPHYTFEPSYVTSVLNVRGNSLNLSDVFEKQPEGVYYAAVVPMQKNGSFIMPLQEQVDKEILSYQIPFNRMKPVTGLKWDGTTAVWDGKSYFDTDEVYTVKLYKVNGTQENYKYEFFKSFEVSGERNSIDLGNVFTAETTYTFTVIAHSNMDLMVETGLTDSPESAFGGIYETGSSVVPPDDHEGWIPISSAKEWIELANIEDIPSEAGNNESPSRQQVEWSKKYYLTADLDFSQLSALDQVKTKSIGNVTNRFMGTIDGNGHKIKGLTLSNSDAGLFWYIGNTGYVYDLVIENANVLFSDNAAVIAQSNYGKIENCAVLNCNITADTGAVLGGMVSRNFGIIRNSYVQGGNLISNSQTATGHAGFAGANEEGGLIERCWTSMDVKTMSDYSGGFIGLGYGGTVRDCFALGDVSARSYSGGFVGRSVYEGNKYENCYAAGTVTVSGSDGYGFIGGNKPDSAFQCDQSEGIKNCYYNAESTEDKNCTGGKKTLDEMRTEGFLSALNKTGNWKQEVEKNGGLPYLIQVAVPEKPHTEQMTVEIFLATYDKNMYQFKKMGDVISITMASNGNTRVVDVLEAAAEQKKLTYAYETSPQFGRYIKAINGYEVTEPDGWMFTINDELSNLSASLAKVKDGDKILWFEGTTENHFQGPTLEELENSMLEWTDISSVEDLMLLEKSSDEETLSKNYRLTKDLDLTGTDFSGIGSKIKPFTGIFDGQGHSISGVVIEGQTDNAGFFNVISDAVIKNLHLKNAEVSGKNNTGLLVGWAQVSLNQDNLAENTANLIGNCTAVGKVSGETNTGGLVGHNDGAYDKDTLFSIESAIDKCAFTGSIRAETKTGGLIGLNEGVVTKSQCSGILQAEGGTIAGGFAGDNSGIDDSDANMDVSAKSSVGGFVGFSTGIVKNSYCLGSVTGTDYTGGFAGSISMADYVLSAGQVTINGVQSSGYVGGFAGQIGGTLTGTESQITIKNAFGNCVQEDEENLPAAGNHIQFPGETEQQILKEMSLDSFSEVGTKLYEMFHVNLNVLKEEGQKYADTIIITADAQPGSKISLLKKGEEADPSVKVTVSYNSEYLDGTDVLKLKKVNETFGNIEIPVTLTLTSDKGIFTKQILVTLVASQDKICHVMDRIAETLTESSNSWTAMDMAAYSQLDGKILQTDKKAKENVINLMITEASGTKTSPGDRSRIEIVLRALGADTNKLYTANSMKKFSNAELLQKMDLSGIDYFTVPYVLLADMQGNVNLTDIQKNQLIKVLKDNIRDGLFGYSFGGIEYSDPDTAGIVLAALAPYYGENVEAKWIVDKIKQALPKALNEKGSFGNANSDAMVITGIAALGENPFDLKNNNGISIVEGLMCYVNKDGNGFLYNGKPNDLATEQGFRALVSLNGYLESGQSYNIYDFSKTPVKETHATGTGTSDIPEEPTNPEEITVYVSVKTNTETWIDNRKITVKSDAMVYHAFVDALAAAGLSQQGAESGYVRSITNNGVTLAEKDKGPNSGWLYTVNGNLPDAPLTQYSLNDGDRILWYYTVDWTQDPDAGGWPETESKSVSQEIYAIVKDGVATANLQSTDANKLIAEAIKNQATSIELNVKGDGTADKVKVELPKTSVSDIADKTGAELIVNTSQGTVTLDKTAMKVAVLEASGTDISLLFEKISVTEAQKEQLGDSAVMTDVSLRSGDKEITTLGSGKLKISLPVPTALAGTTVAAAAVADDGTLTKVTGKTVTIAGKQYYQIEVSGLSSFVVAEEAKIDAAIEAQGGETEAEKIARLKKGVQNTTIKAKSTAGKGYIKVTWTKSKGYAVDKYQIFRSTKRYSGFGNKAFFTTKQGGLTGWYKNTKQLKKGTRYYYKVRGVRTLDGETVYTQWSTKAWRVAK